MTRNLQAVDTFHRRVAAREAVAVRAARHAWSRVDKNNIRGSWARVKQPLVNVLSDIQEQAVDAGLDANVDVMAETGQYSAPEALVDARAFSKFSSGGVLLDEWVDRPAIRALEFIKEGVGADEALDRVGSLFSSSVATNLADVIRQAQQADIAARKHMGFIRCCNADACKWCIVLSGKIYRYNTGFERHMNCHCYHLPVNLDDVGSVMDIAPSPIELFNRMSESEQNKTFGITGARSIRAGADIGQIVNSKLDSTRITKSSRSYFALQLKDKGFTLPSAKDKSRKPFRRLTVDECWASGGRREAIQRLKDNGYILPREFRYEHRGNVGGLWSLNPAVRRAEQIYQEAVKSEDLARVAQVEKGLREAYGKISSSMSNGMGYR
ncbi:hypothetical protein CJI54_04805 [Bifidobacteriaceae bacterium NR026]|nr:hypothetical protein CJI54_04805 [Bifidobacteriaceae bacterium NR026]